jgi:8-hydroxy-5-deazaflavin:NADPH oxidoreductase
MRVGIIGVGNVGGGLATALSKAGHDVVVAASGAANAREAAARFGSRPAASVADAARDAEALILAVPADAHAELADLIEPHVSGKAVVDVSNGPQAVESGRSLAEDLVQRLPEAHVVKAFNTIFASRLAEPVDAGQPLDGYLAGDDAGAKAMVAGLVADVGLEPIDVGGLQMARVLEGMAWLNIGLTMANSWPWRSGWKLHRAA